MEENNATLTLALIQTDLFWENPQANRANLEEKIWDLSTQADAGADTRIDIIVLPEMFTTGFSMDAQRLAEPMNLHTFKWMRQMAAQTKAALAGSFIVSENGHYYNRFLWMQPDGQYICYDKKHLFSMAQEQRYYSPGRQRIIIPWKGWNICPLVCYDLRFPVWSRNQDLAYDLLLYVANWPKPRITAWDALLRARAIENAAYCAGLNRVGTDGNDIPHNGHSQVFGPKGEAYLPQEAESEEAFMVTLSKTDLNHYRQKFPVHLDADAFSL
jgi:omega-amidase